MKPPIQGSPISKCTGVYFAVTAVKNLINELSDSAEPAHLEQMTYSLSTSNTEICHLLLQKSDGQFLLILWQEVSSYDGKKQQDIAVSPQPVTLMLDHSARSISTYEPTVQAQPSPVYANVAKVSLEVPDHPLVIQIEK